MLAAHSDILSTHSNVGQKVDNFIPESVDNLRRNRWTTSIGMGGQLGPE